MEFCIIAVFSVTVQNLMSNAMVLHENNLKIKLFYLKENSFRFKKIKYVRFIVSITNTKRKKKKKRREREEGKKGRKRG